MSDSNAPRQQKPKRYFGAGTDKNGNPMLPGGTHLFRVSKIKPEFVYKKTASGMPYALVPLMHDAGEYVVFTSAAFFFNPKNLKRLADFVEACTGQRPPLSAIETGSGFRAQIEKCVGSRVVATVRLKEPNAQGKVYAEVESFSPEVAPVPDSYASKGKVSGDIAPTPDDVPF
jgi:hypothetical protein